MIHSCLSTNLFFLNYFSVVTATLRTRSALTAGLVETVQVRVVVEVAAREEEAISVESAPIRATRSTVDEQADPSMPETSTVFTLNVSPVT